MGSTNKTQTLHNKLLEQTNLSNYRQFRDAAVADDDYLYESALFFPAICCMYLFVR